MPKREVMFWVLSVCVYKADSVLASMIDWWGYIHVWCVCVGGVGRCVCACLCVVL